MFGLFYIHQLEQILDECVDLYNSPVYEKVIVSKII